LAVEQTAQNEEEKKRERPLIKFGRKRFGQYLVERNRISQKDLDRALALQRESGTKIGKILVDMGFLTERDACLILCEQLGFSYLDPEQFPDSVPDIIEKVPLKFLKANNILPISLDEEKGLLHIVMEDPNNVVALQGMKVQMGCSLQISMTSPSDIQDGLER